MFELLSKQISGFSKTFRHKKLLDDRITKLQILFMSNKNHFSNISSNMRYGFNLNNVVLLKSFDC